ncbi:MAG: ThiF family adenylyltransferase [Candidatus Saccharimonadales bacterium]
MTAPENIKTWLAESSTQAPIWSQPPIYNLSNPEDVAALQAMHGSGDILHVRDSLESTARDLHVLHHPDKANDSAHQGEFVANITGQGELFGRWVYFPWLGQLVHYPEEAEHYATRVFRNHDLVTRKEQASLRTKTTAHLGLSVGGILCEGMVRAGIGYKTILADKARITPANCNRMTATQEHVGVRKTDYIGTVLSGIDPYLKQVHMPDGFNRDNTDVLLQHDADLILEETDDPFIKAFAREFARRNGIPLIMVTDLDGTVLLDVERYDKEHAVPFGGRLKYHEYQELLSGKAAPEDLQRYLVKIVGVRYLTTRMLSSVMEVGKTLGGTSQLGDTVMLGGAIGTKAARAVLLDKPLRSGRYPIPTRKLLKLPPQASITEGFAVLKDFARYTKSSHQTTA